MSSAIQPAHDLVRPCLRVGVEAAPERKPKEVRIDRIDTTIFIRANCGYTEIGQRRESPRPPHRVRDSPFRTVHAVPGHTPLMTKLLLAYTTDRPPIALLVDRDPETRFLYAEGLRHHGWSVDEAGDGPSALAKALTILPDVIVTETRLPGFDGLSLCGLLQRDVSTTGTPVIFVTGDAVATDIEHCHEAGASRVLTKPCLPDELFAAMHALLEQSHRLRPRAHDAQRAARKVLAKANDVAGVLDASARRPTLKMAHHRGYTLAPPLVPPPLVCPKCDRTLSYRRSHIGGVSSKNSEQWDYFDCPGGCGTFQYRSRTRKLRQVA